MTFFNPTITLNVAHLITPSINIVQNPQHPFFSLPHNAKNTQPQCKNDQSKRRKKRYMIVPDRIMQTLIQLLILFLFLDVYCLHSLGFFLGKLRNNILDTVININAIHLNLLTKHLRE